MRKITFLLLVALLSVSLIGCSFEKSSVENSELTANAETSAPLDLTGLWKMENADETYMVATIQDDSIGVFWILEGDETPWTYWVGSYDAPKTNENKYSWVSKSTYAGNGLLASSDSTKTFEYESGKLKYKSTLQGKTKNISLVRGDWDTSKIPESAFGSINTESTDVKDLIIKDSGWCIENEKWLYYYFDVYNPNKDIVVEFPTIRITARDANGALLGTEDQTLSAIYPEQDFVHGFQAFEVEEIPETVEFEALKPEEYNLSKASAKDEYKPLETVNVAVRSNKIVGEVHNPNNRNFDNSVVTVICKNEAGEVIGIETTFVDDVKAGGNTPFEIWVYDTSDIASFEAFANQWW